MSNELQIDIESGEGSPETAYRRSDTYEFPEGKKLEPFSFLRKTTAAIMGLRIWKLTETDMTTIRNPQADLILELREKLANTPEENEEEIASLTAKLDSLGNVEEEVYDHMMLDVAIVLWLCSLPDKKVRQVRRNPEKFEEEMDFWAEENGIYKGSNTPSKQALGTFIAIINDVRNSHHSPDISEETKNLTEEDLGN